MSSHASGKGLLEFIMTCKNDFVRKLASVASFVLMFGHVFYLDFLWYICTTVLDLCVKI